MNKYVIDINELTKMCVTRHRGKEAAEELSKYLDKPTVEIDLRGTELVSLSFLDELICHYLVFVNDGKIKFINNDKSTENKLSRIAAVRSIKAYCHRSQHAPFHAVVAEEYAAPTPMFLVSKT